MNRFWEIDFLRGVAIVMMALFHFLWDLNYFNLIQVSLYAGGWGIFQKATASLFLLLAGIVLTINYSRRKDFIPEFLRRGTTVFALGLVITAATYIFLREEFIYFGILHLIGLSIILSVPLVRRKFLNLFAGAALIIAPAVYNLQSLAITPLVWMGLAPPFTALDFFPLIPWFGVVLIGIFLGNVLYGGGIPKIKTVEPNGKIAGFFEVLGRNSLLIYFSHQFVLFPLAYIISVLI